MNESNIKEIVLGMGCFWCTEAVFQRIEGVKSVTPGYAGGEMKNPTYDDVKTGATKHAEVAKIEYDPERVSLEELLDIFWVAHDPTQINGQGDDIGPQYRSIILYQTESEKEIIEQSKQKIIDQELYSAPIATEIKELDQFYEAEDYHQNFYNDNRNYPYCRVVIDPKVNKVRKKFSDKIINTD